MMPRPMMDVNGPEYQAILRAREMYRLYGHDYKDMMWAEEVLDRLEKKLPYGDYTDKDRADFLVVKSIHARVFTKAGASNGETAGNHSTAHYIWRTQDDGKVRSEHAVNEGKVFAWDDPPPTGHPGEAYGCRCWAEPYAEDAGEKINQKVIRAAMDIFPSWSAEEFLRHYIFGDGRAVSLNEIGHLRNVINHASTPVQENGGSIFDRVANQIIEEARQRGVGSFSDYSTNSYDFSGAMEEFGGSTVTAEFDADVVEDGEFLIVTAQIDYTYTDVFTDPFSVRNPDIGREGVDPPGTMPYPIVGTWGTYLEAVIRQRR